MNIKAIFGGVGGKQRLTPKLLSHLPQKYNIYYEPFVGAGSLLLAHQPKKAVISDKNKELINVGINLKLRAYSLVKILNKDIMDYNNLPTLDHKKDDFLENRTLYNLNIYQNNDVYKAIRFIYLVETCFNNLYRVNKDNIFNSAFGQFKKINLNYDNYMNISKYLNDNEIAIENQDYKNIFKLTRKGDFVFIDPPYSKLKATTFNTFNISQKELADECEMLNEKGVLGLQTNHNTDEIRELYKDYKIEVVEIHRSVSCTNKARTKIEEVIIKNY